MEDKTMKNIENLEENKFAYFWNAIHYRIWLRVSSSYHFGDKYFDRFTHYLIERFKTGEEKEKAYQRLNEEKKKGEAFYKDKKAGFGVGMADDIAGGIYTAYTFFPFYFITGAVIDRLTGIPAINPIVFIPLIIVDIFVIFKPFRKAVFDNDRYLKYYKIFEKKDAAWHRKWKRITIMLILGVVPYMFICGIAMLEILGMPAFQIIVDAIFK